MSMRNLAAARQWRNGLSAIALGIAAFGAQAQSFSINLSFTGLTADQQSYFTAAKSFWENVITGYQNPVAFTAVNISASGIPIDGIDEVLGQAGPLSDTLAGGVRYVTSGVMQFDTADIPGMITSGIFGEVIKHEMAHVLGFGTLWAANGLYNEALAPGHYTGINALNAYRAEFNKPLADWVPVEKAGGLGTAHSHWNENDYGWGATGIRDAQGRDMQNELMTGWLNPPTFVSQTTVASFQDLGYTVNLSAVPELGTAALLGLGLPLLVAMGAARRKAQALSTLPVV